MLLYLHYFKIKTQKSIIDDNLSCKVLHNIYLCNKRLCTGTASYRRGSFPGDDKQHFYPNFNSDCHMQEAGFILGVRKSLCKVITKAIAQNSILLYGNMAFSFEYVP